MIKPLAILLSLALLPIGTLSAKSKAADFSGFKGSYSGTALFTVNLSPPPTTIGGQVSVHVIVPRSGRSAVVTLFGTISNGSATIPFSDTFTMRKSSLSGTDSFFNLSPTDGPFSVPGRLTKRGFNAGGAHLESSTTVFILSSIGVKPKGKKKKQITIDYTVSGGTGSYVFQFVATGRVRE